MSRKIDFHDDPDAPPARHIVPAVSVVVTNDAGEILLIQRTDNNNWALPGGVVDIGESLPQAAIRETREETGIDCEITGLSGIYTDPGHVILYTSNGEVRQEFSIVLTARATGGAPTPSSESSQVRWTAPADLDTYQMDASMRLRVRHYAEHPDQPYIG
jgi:ADP-ribose pyrophosphatase YjhB (NUDIX family)